MQGWQICVCTLYLAFSKTIAVVVATPLRPRRSPPATPGALQSSQEPTKLARAQHISQYPIKNNQNTHTTVVFNLLPGKEVGKIYL